MVSMLDEACDRLREKNEDEFREESNDWMTDDDEWSVPSSMPMVEVKEVREEESQKSQKPSSSVPYPTLELSLDTHKNQERNQRRIKEIKE